MKVPMSHEAAHEADILPNGLVEFGGQDPLVRLVVLQSVRTCSSTRSEA
jgi:hypothetical protein